MARTILGNNLTISVPNDFSTIVEAVQAVYEDYDLAGQYGVQIEADDGSYDEEIEAVSYPVGFGPESYFRLVGNATNPENCVLNCSTGTPISIEKHGYLEFGGFQFEGAGWNIALYNGGYGKIIERCIFGSSTKPADTHAYVFLNSSLDLDAPVDIGGTAKYAFRMQGNSNLSADGQTINVTTSNLNMWQAFIECGRCSTANFKSGTIGGSGFASVIGPRWKSDGNSIIKVWGANPDTFFPGNANGTKTLGGECG